MTPARFSSSLSPSSRLAGGELSAGGEQPVESSVPVESSRWRAQCRWRAAGGELSARGESTWVSLHSGPPAEPGIAGAGPLREQRDRWNMPALRGTSPGRLQLTLTWVVQTAAATAPALNDAGGPEDWSNTYTMSPIV